MAGRVVDLKAPDARIPDAILLDTSVVVTRFAALLPELRRAGPGQSARFAQVTVLLTDIAARGGLAFVAASTFVELAHIVIRAKFQGDLGAYLNPSTGKPFGDWKGLYKQRSGLVKRYARDIDALRQTLDIAGIYVLQPDDLGPIEGGRRVEEELVRLCKRYELDSTDAAILLEARRAGLGAIAAEDSDMRRASRDFDVYTWL